MTARKDYAATALLLERSLKLRHSPATLLQLGLAQLELQQYAAAESSLLGAAASPGLRPLAWYNLACLYSRRGETETALAWLGRAVDSGYRNRLYMRADPDLAALRSLPQWQAIEERIR